MRILVFQYLRDHGPESFGMIWDTKALAWTTVQLGDLEAIPDMSGYDLLVVMGGPMDVWQETEFPWLAVEKAAIRNWVVVLGRPYLGICLGHQLLADVLGGAVTRMAVPEVGITEIALTPTGRADPRFARVPHRFEALNWHAAEVSGLPDGAVRRQGCPHSKMRPAVCSRTFRLSSGDPKARKRWDEMVGDRTQVLAAVEALLGALGDAKVVTAGLAYDAAVHVWNAVVASRPAAVVLCTTVDDVQAVVFTATRFGASLSVKGGGHDWAGRSLKGDIVLDLSRMCGTVVEGTVAVVEGGATSLQVAEATGLFGLTPITGIIGDVGLVGLTLGGGYGHLTAMHGLALDNMLRAEIVLADGRVVLADPGSEPDLFWALRGGGGNFGVVTRMWVRLHPIENMSDGSIVFPWSEAADVIANYDAMTAIAPDGLTVMPTFFAAPSGALSLVLHHTWCGDPRDDGTMIDRVAGLGTPDAINVHRKTLVGILKEAEKRTMYGIHWIVRTVTLAGFDPGAVEIICHAMENRSSPLSWIASHPFYGAGERVPIGSTAFGIRHRHFMLGIYTAWTPGEDALHRAWADGVEAALLPYAMASAYPNYFGSDRPAQAREAYGPNAERLLRAKAAYDPMSVFNATALPAPAPL